MPKTNSWLAKTLLNSIAWMSDFEICEARGLGDAVAADLCVSWSAQMASFAPRETEITLGRDEWGAA
jgi:hypothetical protein